MPSQQISTIYGIGRCRVRWFWLQPASLRSLDGVPAEAVAQAVADAVCEPRSDAGCNQNHLTQHRPSPCMVEISWLGVGMGGSVGLAD